MNNTITIELPLPANALRPNGRAHWAVKMKAVKQARTLARAQMGAAIDTRRDIIGYDDECKPLGYGITWYYWRGVGPDTDNALASCKAYLDGCCDALGVNDRSLRCLEVLPIKECGEARVRITFFFNAGKEGEA